MMDASSARDGLLRASTDELLRLFTRLEAPALQEMSGEYSARLLAQPHWLATLSGRAVLGNPVRSWLGKAFRPVDAASGRGYNAFRQGGRVVQSEPMYTLLAASRFDGRPAYTLVYRHFHSACAAIHMVDEVRRVAPGLYLGMGTWGFTEAQRRVPCPFLLEGPVAPYRGDIGRERKHLAIGRRELPALSAQ